MTDLPNKPRRIWLRSFYGFGPEEDGYIGWTKESSRDRMLNLVQDGDLFVIYGASSGETSQQQRNRVLGFLEVEAQKIQDKDKASAAGLQRKKDNGWADKWTFALPVTRAWRTTESVLLELVAPDTYRAAAGQAISVWSAELKPGEIELALKIKVTEVSVFGEEPIPETSPKNEAFSKIYRPSRAFPGSFGQRSANYDDGETYLYLSRFEGDGHALTGRPRAPVDKSVLMKIGVSNAPRRRLEELNAGFPPAGLGKWGKQLTSQPYPDRKSAETAEQEFKDRAERELQSLGGEFFWGNPAKAEQLFANIPGAPRFKK